MLSNWRTSAAKAQHPRVVLAPQPNLDALVAGVASRLGALAPAIVAGHRHPPSIPSRAAAK